MDDWGRKPKDPPSQFLRLKGKGDQVRIRVAAAPYRELRVWPAGGSKEPPLKSELLADFTAGQWATLLRDPIFDINEVFHLVVIDRADSQAKIFTTTAGVYGKMRDFAQDPDWGNPKSYDFTVTRTEAPGKNYYDVKPSPNKSDLTAAELAKVDALDVVKMLPSALPAAAPQPDDDLDDVTPEPLPWDQPTTPQPVRKLDDVPKTDAAAEEPKKPKLDVSKRVEEAKARNAARAKEEAADPETPPAKPDEVVTDIGDEPINLDDIPF